MNLTQSIDNEVTIINWLKNRLIPVQHIEAGKGFDDLQHLKTILRDVKIVGLGETTHGTHEIFQLKHRFLEFLVTEMGFTAFAIEAGYAACQAINDYVLYGKGDRATVLTGQWYVVWDTEEMATMIDWMRAYNQTVPDKNKVKFYGVDINRNENGRSATLEYLSRFAQEMLASTELLFESLAAEESKWPRRIDEQAEKNIIQLLPTLQYLIDYLSYNKDNLISRSSLAEFNQIQRYVHIMKQWVMTNAKELLPPTWSKPTVRSTSMAENLMYLVDQCPPDTKFIISAHNGHTGYSHTHEPSLGSYLKKRFGQSYFVFGFEFNQGRFQTRLIRSDKFLGDLKEVTLPPAAAGTLAWYLAHVNENILILNLRAPVDNPVVEQWLNSPLILHHVNWAYDEKSDYKLEISIFNAFDGIIFIDTTTASRPTVNALKTVANRDGL